MLNYLTLVVALSACGSDSAASLSPGQLEAVVLSPPTAIVTTSGIQQFSVSGEWSDGAGPTPAVDYSATGGSITSAGLYTAGALTGTFQVVAVQQNGTLADTSAVTIVPPGSNPNEPADYVEIVEHPFDVVAASGWVLESGTPTLLMDANAPISPSSIIRATFSTSFSSGGAPWWLERPLSGNLKSLYYRIAFRHSSNFQGQSSGTNKLGFVWIHDNPAFFLSTEGIGTGDLVATARLQNTADSREYLRPNRGDGVLARGVWHVLEVQLVSNTAGVSNGVVRMWLNGALITEFTDVRFSGTGQANRWEAVSVFPIWGGGSGQNPTSAMTLDFDHIYVSGKEE